MKIKINRIVDDLAGRIKTMPGVEVVTLLEPAEQELHDPYFFLSLDLYFLSTVPNSEERQKLFEDAGAFESSRYTLKDRFFLGDVPVRLEYKDMQEITELVNHPEMSLSSFRGNGTYMFYRLMNSRVLFQNDEWIGKIREKLKTLPDSFWKPLQESFFASMEHYLVDLGSAVIQNDDLFYLFSLSGFLKNLTSLLFALNRTFEPSRRLVGDKIGGLDVLPEHFRGLFDSLVRDDPQITRVRKHEIAELLTKYTIKLVQI